MVEMKPIQKIPLQQIDLSDEVFSVNYLPDLRSLLSSIREWGLIQPVLLRKKKDRFQIVCGFRRVSALMELGHPEIESRVFEEKERSELELFSISLHENLMARGFNTVEKAIALDKLVHHFRIDRMDVIKKFLPLFSLEPNEKILMTFLSLARMEDEVKKYVLKESVSRSNIRMLSAFETEDRKVLIPFLSSLKLGENRLREILTLLDEISRNSRIKVREMVGRPEIEAILSQGELTSSQRTERMKKVLMDLRYPRMGQVEERFDRGLKKLNLPSGITLRHSPYFEGKELKIEFEFRRIEEYRSIVASLSSLADKKEFEEMVAGQLIPSAPPLEKGEEN